MFEGLRISVVLVTVILAGCTSILGPDPQSASEDPPWTIKVDTTYQVCWRNHNGSRTYRDSESDAGPCRIAENENATDLPNGTLATGPEFYLEVRRETTSGHERFPPTMFEPPTWNYTPPCGMWSPRYSVLARHNRCDNATIRERVTAPPLPTTKERREWENQTDDQSVREQPWTAVYPFSDTGSLTLVLHRPYHLEIRVMGEYPSAYKQGMKDPGWCDEGVPPEHRDQIAPAAGGRTWVWSMDGQVAYRDRDVHYISGGKFQAISNEVTVTGDAQLTLAWQGECVGGQY